jgi:hypothetical protein
MSQDVQTNLHTRKWPVLVEYGKRTQRVGRYSMIVVLSRDHEAGDTVSTVLGFQHNPRKAFTRGIGVRADVYVRSSLAGARLCEHEHDCDDLVDALLTALDQWTTAARAGQVEIVEARYLSPDEHDGSDCGAGVVYRLRFRVQRGVTTEDYGGAARETAILAEVGNASTGAILNRPDGTHEVVPDTEPGD